MNSTSNVITTPLSTNTWDYICGWKNCRISFFQQHEQFFIMFVQLMSNIYRIMYVYGMDVID
jgi:hypothetical protein